MRGSVRGSGETESCPELSLLRRWADEAPLDVDDF